MLKKYLFAFLLLVVIPPFALAQDAEHGGIRLYKQGNASMAQAVLTAALKNSPHKSNPDMWNYLGLACLEKKEYKDAIKAFNKAIDLNRSNSDYLVNFAYANLMIRETDRAQSATKAAIKVNPSNPSAYYLSGIANLWEKKLDEASKDAEKAIEVDPAFVQGYVLHADVIVARLGRKLVKEDDQTVRENIDLLRQARDVLRTGMLKTAASPNRKLIERESAAMEAFYDYFSKDRPKISAVPEPGVTPLNIIRKRPAKYTDQARRANIQGAIRVAILFGASGRIEHVLILKGLGYGLDQEALAAANGIVFEPEKKDGKPVSVVRMLEYSFAIY